MLQITDNQAFDGKFISGSQKGKNNFVVDQFESLDILWFPGLETWLHSKQVSIY